jgi:hypothetical protein
MYLLYKVIILLTNFSSITTLYIGYKYNEIIIANNIFLTSIFSFIFHLFDEFNYFVSYDILNYFRIIDFFYSYKSIYVTITCLLYDYNNINYNYEVLVNPLLLWLAINEREKQNFLITIVPSLCGIIIPLSYLQRNNIIRPHIKSHYLIILLLMIIINIFVYVTEKKYDNYHIFHSLHHILCFSIPCIVILYKSDNKKYMNHYEYSFDCIERKRNNSSDISDEQIV